MKLKIPVAQYGTKHGHAEGVLSVMLENDDVEVKGVFESDKERVELLKKRNIYPWNQVKFFDRKEEILSDSTILAVASEGLNIESLPQTHEILLSGKHVFYDKPAGEDLHLFKLSIEIAKRQNLLLQMGYMFRNHDGFKKIASIVFNGEIGRIFQIRANMSTNLTPEDEQPISRHTGGILYDLAGHMIDQIVYLLGRPNTTKSFLRQDISQQKQFSDNTLCVLEFEHAIATVDINSRTINHIKSRRFEVYGDKGSLILEPFEPAEYLRMSFKSSDKYLGINEEYPYKLIPLKDKPRYVENFESFIKTIKGEQKSDRTLEHELLVQETLLRVVGG